jgi:hypothetical protein
MKSIYMAIINFLRKKLEDKEVQADLIRGAEELAKRTTNTFDDAGVQAFKRFWEAYWK